MKPPQNVAVLISGTGSILDAMIKDGVPIDLVVADRECDGLAYARQAGIEVWIVPQSGKFSRADNSYDTERRVFTVELRDRLLECGIDLVVMAGWMTMLSGEMFAGPYARRVLNIHPALLPNFPGAHAVRDALEAYRRGETTQTGTTVHLATPIMDDSTYIVRQVEVPILAADDEARLHERIKSEERRLYPAVVANILSGAINLDAITPRET